MDVLVPPPLPKERGVPTSVQTRPSSQTPTQRSTPSLPWVKHTWNAAGEKLETFVTLLTPSILQISCREKRPEYNTVHALHKTLGFPKGDPREPRWVLLKPGFTEELSLRNIRLNRFLPLRHCDSLRKSPAPTNLILPQHIIMYFSEHTCDIPHNPVLFNFDGGLIWVFIKGEGVFLSNK